MQKKVVKKPIKRNIKKVIKRSKRLGINEFKQNMQGTNAPLQLTAGPDIEREGTFTHIRDSRNNIKQKYMYPAEQKMMDLNTYGSNERAIVHSPKGKQLGKIIEGDSESVSNPLTWTSHIRKGNGPKPDVVIKNIVSHTHPPLPRADQVLRHHDAFSTTDVHNMSYNDLTESRVITRNGVYSLKVSKIGQGKELSDRVEQKWPKIFKEKQEDMGITNPVKCNFESVIQKAWNGKLSQNQIISAYETTHSTIKQAANKVGVPYTYYEAVREDPDRSGYFGNKDAYWNPETEQWDVHSMNLDGKTDVRHVTESVAIRRKNLNKIVKKKPITKKKSVKTTPKKK